MPVGNGQRAVRVGRMRHRKHRPRNSEILEMAPDDLPLSVADAPLSVPWAWRMETGVGEGSPVSPTPRFLCELDWNR